MLGASQGIGRALCTARARPTWAQPRSVPCVVWIRSAPLHTLLTPVDPRRAGPILKKAVQESQDREQSPAIAKAGKKWVLKNLQEEVGGWHMCRGVPQRGTGSLLRGRAVGTAGAQGSSGLCQGSRRHSLVKQALILHVAGALVLLVPGDQAVLGAVLSRVPRERGPLTWNSTNPCDDRLAACLNECVPSGSLDTYLHACAVMDESMSWRAVTSCPTPH